MRTLVYKRTHSGDPDEQGRFGIHDCMGSVRARDYDAVIGVGGIGDEPRRNGIAEKITWIGIGPHKSEGSSRGPLVTFDQFLYFGVTGPKLSKHAPTLAAHIYGMNVRSLLTFNTQEAAEVARILELAKDARPSPALSAAQPDPGPGPGCGGAPTVRKRSQCRAPDSQPD
jgi:hypothetical protein